MLLFVLYIFILMHGTHGSKKGVEVPTIMKQGHVQPWPKTKKKKNSRGKMDKYLLHRHIYKKISLNIYAPC